MKQIHISLSEIEVQDEIVARAALNAEYLAEIEQDIKDGAKLPPVTLFYDGNNYYLVDGRHRFQATKNLKHEMILADIHEGSKRDAILFSCSVNSEYGLRRTNEDKRKAVMKLLTDSEWREWSHGAIADQCAVTQPFVSKVYRELTQNGFESSSNRKGKDGRNYNTENIGRRKETLPELSMVPLPVDDLNPKEDVDSMPDNRPETDSMDSDSQTETENDSDTHTDAEQDKPISSPEQIEKLGEQITNVTAKLSKIKSVFENQSVLTKSTMKSLGKLKEDLQKAWIKLSFELDSLIRS